MLRIRPLFKLSVAVRKKTAMKVFNLNLFLPCLVFAICSCKATNINFINSKNFHARHFGKQFANYYLNASIFKSFTVESELQCLFECVANSHCVSYNYGWPSANTAAHCGLSNTDRFSNRDNFTRAVGFSHRGVMTKCETSSPCGKKGDCIPLYESDSARCNCHPGYSGVHCSEPKSCGQILEQGHKTSGVYTVNPDGQQSFRVYCDMVTDGGGWTVLQRRQDGSVNFYRGWNEYKNGFGDISGEFWLGNDKIHRLTTSQEMVLRFDLEDFEENKTYAVYQDVNILGESDKYKLSFGAYNGTAGDSFTLHLGMYFSTKDTDNDKVSYNCAYRFKGAWWHNNCHSVNINGLYQRGKTVAFATGVNWKTFRGYYYSLKKTAMKIRPAQENMIVSGQVSV